MTEHFPSIAISCDDLNSPRGLENIERTAFLPIHGDVIVTNVEKYPDVTNFVRDHRRRLERVQPGVHISLFDGRFPTDNKGLFGNRGRLHHLLHEIESPQNHREPHYRRDFNRRANHALSAYQADIHDEISRQIEFWERIYGEKPYYLSYHFGMHYIPILHEIYAKVARERDIPYRHAAQYTGLPKRGDLAVNDRLNDRFVTPQRLLVVLKKIRESHNVTEVMVHLGDATYGDAQVRMFRDPRVRDELARWNIEMPHVLWRKLQQKRTAQDSRHHSDFGVAPDA